MYEPDDCLMISGLQHFRFCRRQWALIHIEQQWAENLRTVEGELMHERAHDESLRESRGDTIITRSLRVYSLTLGLSGQCDVVEFRRSAQGVPLAGHDGLWLPYPVEYKRGNPKDDGCDELHRRCALKRCCAAQLTAARCSTASRGGVRVWSLQMHCAVKSLTMPPRCMSCTAADTRRA